MPPLLRAVRPRWLMIVAAIVVSTFPVWASSGDLLPQRPLRTLLPWSPGEGTWEIASGAAYRDDISVAFFTDRTDLRRDEWHADLVDISAGAGARGELRLRFGLQHFNEESGLDKSGIQDARLDFSYQTSGGRRFATALGFGVKLPNASQEDRLGTDATDVFLSGAAGGRGEAWGWAATTGLGILGSPVEAGVQDDVVLLGAAGWWAPPSLHGRLTLLGEISGQAASRFGNDFRELRSGAILSTRRLKIDLFLIRGLTSESAAWGAAAGLTLLLESNHPDRPR